jgi:uncharacterized membrane protein YhaH (DUF805 family)
VKLKELLFSFDGRIRRRDYWFALVPTFVVQTLVFALPGPAKYLAVLLAWPYLAITFKRLHDIGWSGGIIILANFARAALKLVTILLINPDRLADGLVGSAEAAPLAAEWPLILYFLFLAFLGVKPGTDGLNEFGVVPGADPQSEAPEVFS